MARTEMKEKRTRNSKTFDNGDGTFTLEVGGANTHHFKDGSGWVDDDLNWKDFITYFGSGELGYTITFNKSSKSIVVSDGSFTITLDPQNIQSGAKVTVDVSGNTISLAGLWKGTTTYCILAPERPVIEFERTSDTFVNPQILITGDATPMLSAYYQDDNMNIVNVTVNFANNIATYVLDTVPLNKRVR